jgi:hypothetical protein
MTFKVAWRCVSQGWFSKLSDRDENGGGAYTSYRSDIVDEDGKVVCTVGEYGEYVERLSPYNTWKQSKFIKSQNEGIRIVVDPDVEVSDFPIPPKTQELLNILNRGIEAVKG